MDTGAQVGRRLQASLSNTIDEADGSLRRLLSRGEDEVENIFKRVEEKDDFAKKRIRCMTNPDRALETLGPYAQLELTIQAAQSLQPRESWTNSVYTDPYVGVFLDDTKLEGPGMQTLVVRHTTSPLWQHKMSLPIVSPLSMVRLQVYDDQVTTKLEQGFVEFCVGDIPYDTSIEGWFEIRFQDNLRTDSIKRYASHSAMREDELSIAQSGKVESTVLDTAKAATSNAGGKVTLADLKSRQAVGHRALMKTRTLMHGCSKGCVNSSNRSAEQEEHDRGNGGELYVRLKLTKIVSDADSVFALALDMPPPAYHGDYVKVEDPDEKDVRKSLDLQACMDKYTDTRLRLFEDFICCLFYYMRYIAAWRTPWLSGPIALCALLCCYHSYYLFMVTPGIFALLLFLNGVETLRKNMTRGGLNAMISEDGFKRVAKWKNSVEMLYYLKRVVQQDLNGSVKDVAKLRTIAQRCYRDGVPTVTLEELRKMLKSETDVIAFDGKMDSHFSKGDKVIVDERHRAEVQGPAPGTPERVYVVYEHSASNPKAKPGNKDATATAPAGSQDTAPAPAAAAAQQDESIPVEVDRVRRRQTVSFYQTWLLPTSISNMIVDAMEEIDKIEDSAVYPALKLATDIVTWRKKLYAGALCGLLAANCVVVVVTELTYEHALYEADGDQDGEVQESMAWMAISVLRNLDNFIFFIFVFAIFFVNARWFTSVKSFFRILARLPLDRHRRAPRSWAFFREDEQMKQHLQHVPHSQWPDLTDQVKSMARGITPKVTLPDFDKLQKQLSGVRGLSHFKLPELSHPSNQPTAQAS